MGIDRYIEANWQDREKTKRYYPNRKSQEQILDAKKEETQEKKKSSYWGEKRGSFWNR